VQTEPGHELPCGRDQIGRGGGDLGSGLRLHLVDERLELAAGRAGLAVRQIARRALDLHGQTVRDPLVEPERAHRGVEICEVLGPQAVPAAARHDLRQEAMQDDAHSGSLPGIRVLAKSAGSSARVCAPSFRKTRERCRSTL
jgi:hypothetical protein